MTITTTAMIEGLKISEDKGPLVDEVIMRADVACALFASIADVTGGCSDVYESKLAEARQAAMSQLGKNTRALAANAVVGVKLDYEVVGQSMLMVSTGGTAVMI